MSEKNLLPNVPSGNSSLSVTPDSYANEPIRFAALQVVDLASEAAAVVEKYRNQVITRVNGSCLRLAVFDDVFRVCDVEHNGRSWNALRHLRRPS